MFFLTEFESQLSVAFVMRATRQARDNMLQRWIDSLLEKRRRARAQLLQALGAWRYVAQHPEPEKPKEEQSHEEQDTEVDEWAEVQVPSPRFTSRQTRSSALAEWGYLRSEEGAARLQQFLTAVQDIHEYPSLSPIWDQSISVPDEIAEPLLLCLNARGVHLTRDPTNLTATTTLLLRYQAFREKPPPYCCTDAAFECHRQHGLEAVVSDLIRLLDLLAWHIGRCVVQPTLSVLLSPLVAL